MFLLVHFAEDFTYIIFLYYLKLCPKGDYSQIIEDLGKDVLPEEYGGTNGKMQDHIGNFNFKIH